MSTVVENSPAVQWLGLSASTAAGGASGTKIPQDKRRGQRLKTKTKNSGTIPVVGVWMFTLLFFFFLKISK